MDIKKPNIILEKDFIDRPLSLFKFLITNVEWDTRINARMTASFGIAYNYSGLEYPETKMYPPLVPICIAIKNRLNFYPNNCLLNYYRDGNSSMGYHSDTSEDLTPNTGVAIVSLGSTRTIAYRSKLNKEIKYKYKLESGSLLYMNQEIQELWMHAIPKEKNIKERISLSFRSIVK